MIIKTEMSLENFKAWGGAVDTLNRIKYEHKCETLEHMLEEMWEDGMTDTELNDLLWRESDSIYDWLGIRTYDQIKQEIKVKKARLEELQSEYEFECVSIREHSEDYGMNECLVSMKMEEIYYLHYMDEMEKLREEIAELEEELKEI